MQVELLNATPHPEETICRAARNDYMEQYGGDLPFYRVMEGIAGETIADKKRNLIEKLLDRGHFGPFEHVQATFHVKGVSRALMAQITRHRPATFDVQSMRYVTFNDLHPEVGEWFVEIPELGNAELHGRNAELSERVSETMTDEEIALDRGRVYRQALENAIASYKDLLALGTAPENARMVLPIGTKVNIVFSMNARTLMHIADMRGEADSQWEIREMTEAVLEQAAEWCPYTFDYYNRELKGRKNRLAP